MSRARILSRIDRINKNCQKGLTLLLACDNIFDADERRTSTTARMKQRESVQLNMEKSPSLVEGARLEIA